MVTSSASPSNTPGGATVLVVDDHDVFRRGLVRLLRQEGIEVVAEASSGSAAIRLTAELRPAVVLMDLSMPGVDGLHATRAISELAGGARVVALTIADDDESVIDALLAGAVGYVRKDEPLERILASIAAAADGEALIPTRVADEILRRLRAQAPERLGDSEIDLSKREHEVLRLIVEGNDNAAIAASLAISPHTVKKHVAKVFEKLGIDSRLGASVQALRRRLVS
jgi:DNA-binding NarL/FixJ family response regulator